MRVRRTIVECLEEFQSVRFELGWLCDVIPWMRERQFSIASHPKYIAHQSRESAKEDHPTRLQLAVAIVKYRTRLREPRRGVCTAWLASLPVGLEIPFRIEKGTMQLPSDDTTPVIYVGPGTGVAPMRSLLQRRLLPHLEKHGAGESEKVSDANRIYLGFRHSQKDFLFEEDWTEWSKLGLLEWRLAASRETDSKIYVQDLLKEDLALIWKTIGERNGYVLISGSAGKMPEAVRDALKEACITEGDMEEDQAIRFLNAMEVQNRLQEECWS